MKIDLAGFVPNRGAVSGLASNLDVEHAIEKASESYISQIQTESAVLDSNLQKMTALYDLRMRCTDLYTNIISKVNDSLWKKSVFMDNEGYLLANVKAGSEDINFIISDIELAQPQYITIKSFASTSKSATGQNGFKPGIMNIALKSSISVDRGIISLSNNNIIEKAQATLSSGKFYIGRFELNTNSTISVIIGEEEFISSELPDDITDDIVFTSIINNNTLNVQISQEFSLEEAGEILNNAFAIDEGVEVSIFTNDSLQKIAERLNRIGKDIGINTYILRVADHEYNLTIRSSIGHDIVVYGNVLPEHKISHAMPASVLVNGNKITSTDNEFELLVGTLSIRLMNNLPPDKIINLSVEADISLMIGTFEHFCKIYNDLLDFFSMQTARDILGRWKDSAILHNSNSLGIVKNQLAMAMLSKINGRSLIDFGITFDDNSRLYIDTVKFINSLIEGSDRQSLSDIMRNLSNTVKDILHYNGSINKEIDQILRKNELQHNKVANIEHKLKATQAALYKQFSNLEAHIATANHTLKILESQLRS